MHTALRGGYAYVVVPHSKVSKSTWDFLKHYAGVAEAAGIGTSINLTERRIEFETGGWVWMRSAHNEDSLRGDGLDFLMMTEAAMIPGERWTQELRPTLATGGRWAEPGTAWFLSTPRGKRGKHAWFHDFYQRAARLEGWERFTGPSTDNPRFPESEIEEARAEGMLPWEVEQEYYAKFVDVDAGQ